MNASSDGLWQKTTHVFCWRRYVCVPECVRGVSQWVCVRVYVCARACVLVTVGVCWCVWGFVGVCV